jgi:hypothetical protein
MKAVVEQVWRDDLMIESLASKIGAEGLLFDPIDGSVFLIQLSLR